MKDNCRKDLEKRVSMKDMLKLISEISPGFFLLTIVEALLSTAVVFVNIILSARILDGIAGGEKPELIRTALFMVGLNLVLALLRWAINKWLIVTRRRIEDSVSKRIMEKCLDLDYQILEKTSTLDYIQKVESASRTQGGITSYCVLVSEGITKIISVIYAIILLTGFFQGSAESEDVLLRRLATPQALSPWGR